MAEPPKAIARRPPLGEGTAEPATGIGSQLLAIRPLPPRMCLTLRIDPARLPAGGEVAGFALDMPLNRCTISARGTALRLGPDEWLLWAPEEEAGHVAADAASALAGRHFSVVDVSQGRAALAVSGAEAAAVLNAGCPLDLSPAAFPAGSATRTLVGKCEVVLARTDDGTGEGSEGRPAFEVECARSFAAYLRDFLLAAARELRARS